MLLSLGEPQLFARLLSLWLQTYDAQAGVLIHYDQLDYAKLIAWLDLISTLDPHSNYVFLSASRVFSEVKDHQRLIMLIEFIHKKYLASPQRLWRWQAEVVLIAKHRLKDLALARKLADDLSYISDHEDVPYWVKDIRHLILAEMGEFQSAALLISSMLETGVISDANEIRFLSQKLKTLQAQMGLKGTDD